MLFGDEILAATGAGCASTVVGHPLDTVKVHMQTTGVRSTIKTAQYLVRQRALFRGITPPLVNAIVMNSIMFGVFRGVKDLCGDSFTGSMTAGIISGFTTACISTPTDYVKIQAQLQGIQSLDLIKKTIKSRPYALFRGHIVNLGREGVFTMVYLGLYDILQPEGFVQVAAASSATGALAWVASYPMDTVKSVVQGSKLGISTTDAVSAVWRRGGSSSFYAGCLSSTGRAILVTSLRMVTYEAIADFLS